MLPFLSVNKDEYIAVVNCNCNP